MQHKRKKVLPEKVRLAGHLECGKGLVIENSQRGSLRITFEKERTKNEN